MNIKIVDSWLREYLNTKATSSEISKILSLTSVSVEKYENETYDIEVTTNRPDLMSVVSIAKEAAAVLPEHGTSAKFNEPRFKDIQDTGTFPFEIKNDPELVNRICAVVMEVEIGKSPAEISKRLELSGIRSLNNLIDVTNYVMREIGHPCHVFDFDALKPNMLIRQSKQGEEIVTLDGKKYRLYGGDIVLDDGTGQIIDLLGVMGTQNSVVRDNTKKIVFFIDNNNPKKIRNTSMSLGIRTEAAILNEKGIDPGLTMDALKRGVELYQKIANGRVVSKVLDIYPNRPNTTTVSVNPKKVSTLIGQEVPETKQIQILEKLGFVVKKEGMGYKVTPPSYRPDVSIEEDVVEEIARVNGYEKLPSVIPTFLASRKTMYADSFYFERRLKEALKYLGFTESYTYSLVSEAQFQGPTESAIKIKNPLSEDMEYLRNSLIPSLLKVVEDNKKQESLKIFELANVYIKRNKDLPDERLMLGGVIKDKNATFYNAKGIIEVLLQDLGLEKLSFKQLKDGIGADVYFKDDNLGNIEVVDTEIINFELDFNQILKHATLRRQFNPIAKYPPIVEDLTIIVNPSVATDLIVQKIKEQSNLIEKVLLKDTFEETRTFQITYQSLDRNLTKEEVSKERQKIQSSLIDSLNATVK